MSKKEVREMNLVYNPAAFDAAICESFGFPEGLDDSAYEAWRSSLSPVLAKMPRENLLAKLSAAEQSGG